MEGYIFNGSGKAMHIFKRKFPSMHKLYLDEIWPMYEEKVKKSLAKKTISENDFVSWLEDRGLMKPGFKYVSAEKASVEGAIVETTSSSNEEEGIAADGRLHAPSLADRPSSHLNKLTYNDIANLRVIDNPKKIVAQITNRSKLRRAMTVVRQAGRKSFLEKILRERLRDLEGRM